MENARFLSLISDGTTDSSISEAEIVFVWYSIDGVVATSFVGVENVTKADAPSIKCAIDGVVEKHLQLSKAALLKKLVSFGCDGAAVMVGVFKQ